MEKLIPRIAAVMVMALTAAGLSAQCEPDTVNCIDTGDPGQICPAVLPEATLDEAYDESITVLSPSSFNVLGSDVDVAYIVVDSVLNLPPGITYWASADQFYADSAYCIQLYGTPEEEGEFQLSIYVTPFIYFPFPTILQGTQVVDDTAVSMTVNVPSGIDPSGSSGFRVYPVFPNPFSDVVRVGFYTPAADQVSLRVYNILGELKHEESAWAPPGEHRFGFDGSSLLPGTYFYRINSSRELYTGKFIKSR
ncbi:MAG: T9SS type A sorting domain-containing protein [Bacteroidales bacterium]